MDRRTYQVPSLHFRYLDINYVKNPLAFIKDFCGDNTSLELIRNDLYDLINAAYTVRGTSPDPHFKNPAEYVYTHRELINVLDVLWLIWQNPELCVNISESHYLYQSSNWKTEGSDVDKRLKGPAKNFRKLEDNEVNTILVFLNDLFSYNALDNWRRDLDELLLYAYADGIPSSFEKLVPNMNYLEKMLEAIFLIAVLNDPDIEKNMVGPDLKIESTSNANTKTFIDLDNLVAYLDTYHTAYTDYSATFNSSKKLSEKSEKAIAKYFINGEQHTLFRTLDQVYRHYLTQTVNGALPQHTSRNAAKCVEQMNGLFNLLELLEDDFITRLKQ